MNPEQEGEETVLGRESLQGEEEGAEESEETSEWMTRVSVRLLRVFV